MSYFRKRKTKEIRPRNDESDWMNFIKMMERQGLSGEEKEYREIEKEENGRLKELQRMQEEEDRKLAMLLKAELQKESANYGEQQEQERRDYELSYSLFNETNPQRNEMSLQSWRPDRSNEKLIEKKYDLSNYKYSELRDIINTSCEIELLEACKFEFHRRLKTYHAWKAKNKKRTTTDEKEIAIESVMEDSNTVSIDRYFRIPFMRPLKSSDEGPDSTLSTQVMISRGWWYAHFHGQHVARQIEIWPNKPAVLMQAGIHDMQLCELSLEETGLTRKRGAEISENEFNQEWQRHGGKPYMPPDTHSKSQNAACQNEAGESTDCYFRIPFMRPLKSSGEGAVSTQVMIAESRGWWYAHFHGQHVVRQMEIWPNKPAVLLLAGIHDMQLCELSLEETGLTRKRGAEISENEFNQEWQRHGGKPYMPPDTHSKSQNAAFQNEAGESTDRYFRIPFMRPLKSSGESAIPTVSTQVMLDESRGWWYAHFHGHYVVRQMEIWPNKPAVLLLAGIYDMQLCELSLEETGLTRKRGAEISENEFNQEWQRHGGKPYMPPDSHSK